jgi:hypothetical protein
MALPLALPPKFSNWLSLGEVFDQLGRWRFGDEWTGTEVNASETPSLAEAKDLHAQLDAARAALLERNAKFDDHWVSQAIAVHEQTGDLETDPQNDPEGYEFGLLVARVHSLRLSVKALPRLDPPDQYGRQYELSTRRREIERSLIELLRQGAVTASARSEAGLIAIPSGKWHTTLLELALADSCARVGSDFYSGVVVDRHSFQSFLRELPRTGQVSDEAKATSLLVAMMTSPEGCPTKAYRVDTAACATPAIEAPSVRSLVGRSLQAD